MFSPRFLVWMAASGPAIASAANLPRLAIAPVRFAPHGDDRVGARRSGMLCLPAGTLSWRDVGADGGDLARRAASRLRAGGVELAAASADRMEGGIPPSRMRIVATVERLHLDACLPWRGLNVRASRGPVTGTGRLVVTWRVFEVSSRELVAKVSSCRDFTVKSAATIEAALGEAFADSANVVVPRLDPRPSGSSASDLIALPAALTCAAGEIPTTT